MSPAVVQLGDNDTCESPAVVQLGNNEPVRRPGPYRGLGVVNTGASLVGSLQALVQVSSWSLFGTFRTFSSSWDDWCGLLARVDHLRGWSIGLHLWWLVWWLVTSPSAEPDELLVSIEGVPLIGLNTVPSVIVLVSDVPVGVP